MATRPRIGVKTPWQETDAAWLRQVLESVEGQRMLSKLFSLRPKASEKSEAVKRAIQSGVQEGFEEMLNNLQFLTTPQSVDKTQVRQT